MKLSAAGVAQITLLYEPGMNSDFSDIRFTAEDCGTLLDYCRVSYTAGVSAIFQFNAIGTKSYIYLGNPSATYTSTWTFAGTLIESHDVESGFVKNTGNPVIPVGPTGADDDYNVYGVAPWHENGITYLFNGGARNSSGNPHLETSIFLSTSSDETTFTKYGKIVDRSIVTAGSGLAPFSIQKIGSIYYMFCTAFDGGSTTYRLCYLTSTDLYSWGGLTYFTGVDASAHAPAVIFDPTDSTKLIVYYTGNMLTTPCIKRATASASNPAAWSNNATVLAGTTLYPWPVWKDDHYELYYIAQLGSGYATYKTASKDGLSFPASLLMPVPAGSSGQFDAAYVSTPRILGDKFYYSGRATTGASVPYDGIGQAVLTATGGIVDWGLETGAVDVSTAHPHGGSYGGRLIGGASTPSIVCTGKGKNKTYRVSIYDDLATIANFQNTFRLMDSAGNDVVLGIWTGTSTTKYVYRKKGGTWMATTVTRTTGQHTLSFDVTDAGVAIKADGTLIATDTLFNVNDIKSYGMYGYTAGIGYFDDMQVLDLSTVFAQVGTEIA